MNNPQHPERYEKYLNGVDDRLDTVNGRRSFSPPHCEVCGTKADEYYVVGYLTVCNSCVRPWEREYLKRK